MSVNSYVVNKYIGEKKMRKYTKYEKFIMIKEMTKSVKVSKDGLSAPNYKEVSEYLNIPESTLKYNWAHKDNFLIAGNVEITATAYYIAINDICENALTNIYNELNKKLSDPKVTEQMSPKDLSNIAQKMSALQLRSVRAAEIIPSIMTGLSIMLGGNTQQLEGEAISSLPTHLIDTEEAEIVEVVGDSDK